MTTVTTIANLNKILRTQQLPYWEGDVCYLDYTARHGWEVYIRGIGHRLLDAQGRVVELVEKPMEFGHGLQRCPSR